MDWRGGGLERWWIGEVVDWRGGGLKRWWIGEVVDWRGGGLERWWIGEVVFPFLFENVHLKFLLSIYVLV